MKPLKTMVAASALLSGCTVTPSIGVLGAYFPDWLFCIVGGITLTLIFSAGMSSAGVTPPLSRRGAYLLYPAIATLCALICWLIIFQN